MILERSTVPISPTQNPHQSTHNLVVVMDCACLKHTFCGSLVARIDFWQSIVAARQPPSMVGRLLTALALHSLTMLLCCCCTCRFGYNPAAKVRVCNECPVEYYSNVGTQGVCWKCPGGMTTLKPGATTSTDCVCKVGHGRDVTGTDEGGCDPCLYPFYQGVLNQNLQPVTTATPETPRPLCLKCSSSTLTYMVIGDPERKCVVTDGTKGSYCVNDAIFTSIDQSQPACTT